MQVILSLKKDTWELLVKMQTEVIAGSPESSRNWVKMLLNQCSVRTQKCAQGNKMFSPRMKLYWAN